MSWDCSGSSWRRLSRRLRIGGRIVRRWRTCWRGYGGEWERAKGGDAVGKHASLGCTRTWRMGWRRRGLCQNRSISARICRQCTRSVVGVVLRVKRAIQVHALEPLVRVKVHECYQKILDLYSVLQHDLRSRFPIKMIPTGAREVRQALGSGPASST